MKELFRLKNFGPIRELDLEIKPLMVFIGESGSGKSAILKLMALLRWIHKRYNLQSYFLKKNIISEKEYYTNWNSEQLLRTSDIYEFISNDTEIYFEIDGVKYCKKGGLPIKPESNIENPSADKVIFLSENRGVLPSIMSRRFDLNTKFPFYLEDTFANFNKAVQEYSEEFSIAATLLSFIEKKGTFNSEFFINGKGIDSKYFEIKFENSSSGTKTALFLELIVDYYTQKYNFIEVLENGYKRLGIGEILSDNKEKKMTCNLSVFIEEPELSLFPSAQRRLIKRLIKNCFLNNKQKECTTRLAFATHSPYLLTSLNNMLLAGELARTNPEKTENIKKVVPQEYWLTTDKLGAFCIEDGIVKPTIYEEDKLINGEYLDSISDDISDEFSKLLDIKYGD